MRTPIAFAIAALASLTFVSSALAQPSAPDSSQAGETAPRLVLVGAYETYFERVEGVLTMDRHWVLIGKVEGGTLTAPKASDCQSATVTFDVQPIETGKPGPKVSGVTLSGAALRAWGGEEVQESVRRAVEMPGGLYCVAVVSHAAPSASPQRVVARLEVDSAVAAKRTPYELRYLTSTSTGAYGSAVEFPGWHIAPPAADFAIVDHTSEKEFGFAGLLLPGRFAVRLALRETNTRAMTPPTRADCASAQVRFALDVPEKAGLTPTRDTVNAYWVDASAARGWFPNIPEESVAPYCMAATSLMLSDNVGVQRVTAEVLQSTPAGYRLVDGAPAPAPPRADQRVAFAPIRAHARPRPFLGVLTAGGAVVVATDTLGEESRSRSAVVAGFDFALEPVLPLTDGKLGGTRLALGTNISGDLVDTIYVGLSFPSLFSVASAASPVDVTAGLGVRREDKILLSVLSLHLNLSGTVAVLREVLML